MINSTTAFNQLPRCLANRLDFQTVVNLHNFEQEQDHTSHDYHTHIHEHKRSIQSFIDKVQTEFERGYWLPSSLQFKYWLSRLSLTLIPTLTFR